MAQRALSVNDTSRQSSLFYESKIATMKFFFKYELPKHLAISSSLMNPEMVTIKNEKEILM